MMTKSCKFPVFLILIVASKKKDDRIEVDLLKIGRLSGTTH